MFTAMFLFYIFVTVCDVLHALAKQPCCFIMLQCCVTVSEQLGLVLQLWYTTKAVEVVTQLYSGFAQPTLLSIYRSS